jgi:histidine ammonia-lyase
MIAIDGQSLTLSNVVTVARDKPPYDSCVSLAIDGEVRTRLREIRKYVEENWLTRESELIYGFNTGLGRLKDWNVPQSRLRDFQRFLIDAHAAGTGDPFPADVVRGAMLLRVNANARGHSGVRVELLDRLVSMLASGVHPIIPQKGSVGAS